MSQYEPTSKLREDVEKGNVSLVREVLQSILNDNADHEVREALTWAASQMPRLFEGFKPELEPLKSQQSDWDADYYYIQKATLGEDFSRERFEHLIAVRDCLRARGDPAFRHAEAAPQMRPSSLSAGTDVEGSTPGQASKDKQGIPWGYVAAALCAIGICVLVGVVIVKRIR